MEADLKRILCTTISGFAFLLTSACNDPAMSPDGSEVSELNRGHHHWGRDFGVADLASPTSSPDLATPTSSPDLASPTSGADMGSTTASFAVTGAAPSSGPVGTIVEVIGSGFQTGDAVQLSGTNLTTKTLATIALTSTAIYAAIPSVGVSPPVNLNLRVIRAGAVSASSATFQLTAGHAYFLAPSGDDAAAGTSAAPWATVNFAASKMVAGDVAYLRGGTYSQRVTISASGTASAPITFTAYPGETPTIASPSISPGSDIDAVTLDGAYVVLDHLRMTNLNNPGQVVFINFGASHITISNSEVFGSYGQGILVGGGYNTIYRCNIHDNGSVAPRDHGIYVEGPGNTFRSNVIHDNFTFGLQLYNGYSGTMGGGGSNTVEYNYLYGNGFKSKAANPSADVAGMVLAYPGGNNVVRYNVSCGNAEYGFLMLDSITNNQLTSNVTCYNAGGGIFMKFPGSGNTVTNNVSYNDSAFALSSNPGVTSDNATYFVSGSSPKLVWEGTSYSLAGFQSASGEDAHSTIADPKFTSVPSTGFKDADAMSYNFCTIASVIVRE